MHDGGIPRPPAQTPSAVGADQGYLGKIVERGRAVRRDRFLGSDHFPELALDLDGPVEL